MENPHKYQLAFKIDECEFCVREYWKPWLKELLDIEGECKEEETEALFNARDAFSNSEHKIAMSRREVAAEAILSIRAAKHAVLDVLEAIDNENARRYAEDKAIYGIIIKNVPPKTNYKEKIRDAAIAKKAQERQYAVMKAWMQKWEEYQEKKEKNMKDIETRLRDEIEMRNRQRRRDDFMAEKGSPKSPKSPK